MKQWWQSLQPRERRLVASAVVLMFGLAVYLLVWEPMIQARDQLQHRVATQEEDLVWMQQAAFEIQRSQRIPTIGRIRRADQRSLPTLLDGTARSAGLGDALKRVEPQQGGKAFQVRLEQASFDAVLRWLFELSQQYGVDVTNAVVERDTAAGRVEARLVLQEGSL